MFEVPKIVYDRLGAGERQEGHPDPDVLTAFVEQALSAQAREGVLQHLALCRDCREVVALSLPPLEAACEPVAAGEVVEAAAAPVGSGRVVRQRPRWLAWQGVRWAALAAGVVVVGSVLILRPGRPNESPRALAPKQAENATPDHAIPAPSAVPVAPALSADKITPPALAKADHLPSAVAADQLRSKDARPAPTRAQALEEKGTFLADNERRDVFATDKKLQAGLRVPAAISQGAASNAVGGNAGAAPIKESAAARGAGSSYGVLGGPLDKRQLAAVPPAVAPATPQPAPAMARGAFAKQAAGGAVSGASAGTDSTRIGLSIERGRGPLYGQAELVGMITDPSGAVMAGAKIEARRVSTGETRTATTDASGRFSFSALPADDYKVQLSASGFRTATRDVALGPQDRGTLLAQLSVGQTAETVTVEAAAPAMETTAARTETVMARAEVAPIVKSKPPASAEVSSANVAVETTTGEVQSQVSTAPVQNLAVVGRNVTGLAMLSVPGEWRISSHKLERSLDHGKTWSTVLNADHPLLCHAENANDIWAGGKAGTLFHSTDGGTSWMQVQPAVGDQPLKADIIRIEVHSAAEIVLFLQHGEVWTTSDSGKTWTRK